MRKLRAIGLALLAVSLFGFCLLTGCESSSSLTGSEFFIDPPIVTLASSDEAFTMTAVGGEEPMTWSVSDAALGTVTTNGRSVVYARTALNGVNIVTVVDAKTWTATSTVTQRDVADENLAIAPTAATIAANGGRQVFEASGGSPPYEWSVANGARGRVDIQHETRRALYTRLAAGDNTVIVRDRRTLVAIATLTQPELTGLSISANPATLANNGDKAVLTASGGTPPYTWAVHDDALGGLNTTTGSNVVYTRNNVGNNVIHCTDVNGVNTSIIVTQP